MNKDPKLFIATLIVSGFTEGFLTSSPFVSSFDHKYKHSTMQRYHHKMHDIEIIWLLNNEVNIFIQEQNVASNQSFTQTISLINYIMSNNNRDKRIFANPISN